MPGSRHRGVRSDGLYDRVIVLDVGEDVVGTGNEPTLLSPLAD
ncbi:MAG: DUF1152 domain-containing protein [Dermatophilaceae bacterium]